MKQTIKIGEKSVQMEANALTPIKYKKAFGDDVFKGMTQLKKASGDPSKFDSEFMFRIAYIMAVQGGSKACGFEEWLSMFEFMDIYAALPQIASLWGSSIKTTSTPKKK